MRRGWVIVLVCVVSAGCSDAGHKTAGPFGQETTATLLGGLPTTTVLTAPEAAAVRLAAVNNTDIQMGAEFNRAFLTVQFEGVGFTPTETQCLVDAAAETQGPAFATSTLAALQSDAPFTPDRLMKCVPMERMSALVSSGTTMDFSRVDSAQLNTVVSGLTSAALVAGGLTPVEATCVTDRLSARLDPATILGGGAAVPQDALAAALPSCLSEDRIAEVGR